MKIYFGGLTGHIKRLFILKNIGVTRIMLTYAEKIYYNNNQIQRFKSNFSDILLDSGAFSVKNSGKTILIDEYIYYILTNNIKQYIVLDEIGNPVETMKNQKIMEENGTIPIPVFHMGSPIDYLYCLVDKYSYICLGGMVKRKFKDKIIFLTNIFNKFPFTKFHGLGVTDTRIIANFPFYSVDSTTWLVAAKFKKILNDQGKQILAPTNMDLSQRIQHNAIYFYQLERRINDRIRVATGMV